MFRRYFERAPGWVLLTDDGTSTGLPREVLPCERTADELIVISTYGHRSTGCNIDRDRRVRVTCAGWGVEAEVERSLEAKRAIVQAHPFFAPAPFALLNFLHRTVLRPLWVPFLRWWGTDVRWSSSGRSGDEPGSRGPGPRPTAARKVLLR